MSRSSSSKERASLVRRANEVLALCGIDIRVSTPKDCTSSMLVACVESLLRLRLPDIVRRPSTKDDLVVNARTVLDTLERLVQQNFHGATPDGDTSG